jgi:hypothetical protein
VQLHWWCYILVYILYLYCVTRTCIGHWCTSIALQRHVTMTTRHHITYLIALSAMASLLLSFVRALMCFVCDRMNSKVTTSAVNRRQLADDLERFACGMLYVLNAGKDASLPATSNGIADSMLMMLANWGQDYRQCSADFLQCLLAFGSPHLLDAVYNPRTRGGGAISFRPLPADWSTNWKIYSAAYRSVTTRV